MAYNLKKYLKFVQKRTKSGAGSLALFFSSKTLLQNAAWPFLKALDLARFQGLRLIKKKQSRTERLIFVRVKKLWGCATVTIVELNLKVASRDSYITIDYL